MAFWKNDDSFAPFNVPQVGPTIPAMPTPDARDAEIAKLRADLDQARRDRNSAVECAEVLRGYVAEGKAEIAKLRAERAIHLASIAEHSKQLAAARAECERERMRLVACGVVAMSDTPDSLDATLAKIAADYRSASLDDVTRTVRALIAARAALDGEREACNRFWASGTTTRDHTDEYNSIIDEDWFWGEWNAHSARRAAEAKASRGGEAGA